MKILLIIFSIFSGVFVGVHPVWSVVTPGQVVVVANRNQPESVELGTYYLAGRGIPTDHLIALDLPKTESITSEEYNQKLYGPLRDELQRRGLGTDIRVLITLWGVPLVVKGVVPTSEEESWMQGAHEWSASATSLLEEQESKLHGWLHQEKGMQLPQAGSSSEETSGIKSFLQQQKLADLKRLVMQAIQEGQLRVATMENAEQQKAGSLVLERSRHRIFGRYGVPSVSEAKVSAQSGRAQEEAAVRNLLVGLLQDPTSAKRSKAYEVVQEAYGLLGVVALANWEVERYRQEDSQASVDSELAMLWWEAGTYPLAGRIPNPWYMGYPADLKQWPFPVLMVSRIDAPTVAIARKMIDQAIATEGKGLTGNIYVDARGMKGGSPLSYGHYDTNLQEFAKGMSGIKDMTVILENTEQRFSQPGQAPDVSLYVGWYHLRNYEDAFTFRPGSIGYHIASGEAVSIHNPKEPGWCKNALERGITVTLGPVREPFLDAFPLPTEFFGLLYSGQYSLVEAYALSSRYLSWQMVLLGDPLYRPWKGRDPDRDKAALTLLNRKELSPAPAERAQPDPSREDFEGMLPGKYLMLNPNILQP